jgi:hypothetical protein
VGSSARESSFVAVIAADAGGSSPLRTVLLFVVIAVLFVAAFALLWSKPWRRAAASGPAPDVGSPSAEHAHGAYHNSVAPTNTMAILSLVFAFVFCPLAIVFGHVARKQIRERGEGGSGLAMSGLVLGYVFTAIQLAFWAAIVFVFVRASNGQVN